MTTNEITEAEAARILMVAPEDVVGEILTLESALGITCSYKQLPDDSCLFAYDDVVKLANGKLLSGSPLPTKRITVREMVKRETEKANRATEKLKAAFFSDPGRRPERQNPSNPKPASPSSREVPALSVEGAAKRHGLSEAELTTRVIGKAKLEMVDGKMLIRKSDLDRLASEGKLPDPSKRRQTDKTLAEMIEGKPTRDSSAEARTDAMAKAIGAEPATDKATDRRTQDMAAQIGVDISKPALPSKTDKPIEDEPQGVPGVVTVTADRKRRRLGAPLRWGQN